MLMLLTAEKLLKKVIVTSGKIGGGELARNKILISEISIF